MRQNHVVFGLALLCGTPAFAQEPAAGPPSVLIVTREQFRPGNMATQMIAGLVTGDPDKVAEIEGALAAGSPLPGRGGKPDDIAHAVMFFASDYAGWITGQTLSVDGGK